MINATGEIESSIILQCPRAISRRLYRIQVRDITEIYRGANIDIPETGFDAIDLFAGCGGLSLGLHQAGWSVLTAVERSPMAARTYFENFIASTDDRDTEFRTHLAKSPADQIRAGLLVDDIEVFLQSIATVRDLLAGRELSLLAGGPPCQGFSLAGRRSPDDPRNALVWRFLEVAQLLAPLLVLMENVPAIQSAFEHGKKATILGDLEEALRRTSPQHGGYAIVRLLLRADHYGVPQRRKRVFVIGVRKDVANKLGVTDGDVWDSERYAPDEERTPMAPQPSGAIPPSAHDAIWDLLDARYAPLASAPSPKAAEYAQRARAMQGDQAALRSPRTDLAPPNHTFRSHKAATQTRFHLLRLFREHGVPNHLFVRAARGEHGIEPELKPLERFLPIRFALREVTTLRELAYLVRSLGSLKHSQRALDRDSPSPTVTTLPDDLGHYAADRTLTIREVARLQSFPDTFVFKGKETTGGEKRRIEVPQYSQVGNAVPPLLAQALAIHFKRLLLSCRSPAAATIETGRMVLGNDHTAVSVNGIHPLQSPREREGGRLASSPAPTSMQVAVDMGRSEGRPDLEDQIPVREP